MKRPRRVSVVLAAVWGGAFFAGAGWRILADCSSFGLPFNDLGSTSFCAEIAEAYFAGLTNGTSATTYNPGGSVSRQQMAAFVTRTLDQSLLRGNRRAALDQWWTTTPHYDQSSLGLTTLGGAPQLLKSDGTDVWVANAGTVSRVRSSDGKLLDTWTGATGAYGVLIAMGRVFVTGNTSPGALYSLDPTAAAGAVTTISSALGNNPLGITFDGNRIWTANADGTVSRVTPGSSLPWSVTNTIVGNVIVGAIFDGSNVWVTDAGAGNLLKLNTATAAIVETVQVEGNPEFPAFDGRNIWVPNAVDNSLTVVRASDGTVLKTFSPANDNWNGLNSPRQAAFDGQRILVTNFDGGLSLFRATDLGIIGNLATPGATNAVGVCSDGVSFWVSFFGSSAIGRF